MQAAPQWIWIACFFTGGFAAGLFVGYAKGYGSGVLAVLNRRQQTGE